MSILVKEISINKRILWKYVNLKIHRSIHYYHVFSIITILFDELLEDLKSGQEIKIFNFGSLQLKNTNPRRYHDVRFKKILLSKPHRILRFILAPVVRKKMCKHIDLK